jgi:methylglutaconyl-CoA hydratase
MIENVVLSAVDERGVATLTLNRPEVHNAYNGAMIDGLIDAVDAFAADRRVRMLVLRANGKHFQAGADLAWLREVAGFALEDNVAFSRRTTAAMRALNAFPRPTLALVHGACYGGGVGMVASCDVAIATATASFALSEVRGGSFRRRSSRSCARRWACAACAATASPASASTPAKRSASA